MDKEDVVYIYIYINTHILEYIYTIYIQYNIYVCVYMCVCVHTHTLEYYSVIKKNEILPFAAI